MMISAYESVLEQFMIVHYYEIQAVMILMLFILMALSLARICLYGLLDTSETKTNAIRIILHQYTHSRPYDPVYDNIV